MGFQRVDNPLAESRDSVSGGVRGKALHKPSSVSHRVNLETVSTVSKEGHALQVKAALLDSDILLLAVYYKR